MGLSRVNGDGPAGPGGPDLFAGLGAHAAPHTRAYAAPVSFVAHAAGLTVLVLLSVARVAPPPTPAQDPLYIPLFGPPVALPPLPKGDAGATRTRQPRAPDPPALTAPVESSTVEPVPADPPLTPAEPSESTGSPLGAVGGTLEGSEAGKAGGQAGGVAWGDPRGIVDGTGEIAVARPDQPPRLLQRVQPVYPQDAFVRRIQGVVKLQILIDARGRVARANVIESIPDLDEAARAAVRQWVFAPAVKDGRPVATLAIAPVRFQIF